VSSAVQLLSASKTFGKVTALNNVSLEIQGGEIVAILGPNGAGKTTAISLMLGLRSPDTGSARVFGQDPRRAQARDRFGVMLQDSDVPATLRVREVVNLVGSYYPQPMGADQALGIAGLTDKANAMAASLSGGQKKRLFFALSLVGNPDILFLDEPTAALDVEAQHSFRQQVSDFAKSGKTIVMTTHNLEEADALAERIIVINRGEIVAQGSPAQMKAKVGGKLVHFKAPGQRLSAFEHLPGVVRSSLTSETFELYTPEPERVLREIFSHDFAVTDLDVRGGGLEEAFIELTTHSAQGASA
jgi:ABC-2 type transport system ATP-binding protein